jgi:hypothetical protein
MTAASSDKRHYAGALRTGEPASNACRFHPGWVHGPVAHHLDRVPGRVPDNLHVNIGYSWDIGKGVVNRVRDVTVRSLSWLMSSALAEAGLAPDLLAESLRGAVLELTDGSPGR